MATISIMQIEPFEYLYAWRKRLKINQVEMAEKLGIDRHELSEIELGKSIVIGPIDITLTEVEKCILLRRRKGWKQGQLADILGVTRTWIRYMETGGRNPARLIEYWSS